MILRLPNTFSIFRAFISSTLFIVSLLMSVSVYANPSDVALKAFPASQPFSAEESTVNRYRLILSELDNEQGKISGEVERRLSGQLYRRIDDLPAGLSLDEVLSFYRNQANVGRVLYTCRGLDCGSSHFWANEVFGVSRLVSREKDQAYFVSLSTVDGKNHVSVVYISLRGGREPKALVDTLLTSDAVMEQTVTMDDVRTALADSSGWLPGFEVTSGQFDSASSKPLITVINQLSAGVKSRLQLVVHCYRGTHIDDTFKCSDTLADELKAVLPGISVRSQGALTPSPDAAATPALRFVMWPGR